jgi:hypothetical protein
MGRPNPLSKESFIMRRIARLLVASVAVASTFAITQTARAESLEACGDFFFDPVGDVECTVEVEGGCEAACTPVSVEVECAADLQIGCQGGCDVDIEVGCDVDCEADCNIDCDPGTFDCGVECSAGCEADCDAQCNDSECSASCSANCSASCSASCEASPPTCEGGCQAKCEGQCKAEASASCQIDCQAEGYIDCKADLQGGCEVACQEPKGAVFCDGQWVNTDDLDSCVDAIIARFDIEVTGYAEADCSGNTCTAEAGASCSACSMAPSSVDSQLGFMMVGLAAAGLAVARRRTRKA